MMNPLRSIGALLGIASTPALKIDDSWLDGYTRSPKTPKQRRARAKAKRGRAMRKANRRRAR